MASKHKITVGEELRYDSDVQGLRNLNGTYVPQRTGPVRGSRTADCNNASSPNFYTTNLSWWDWGQARTSGGPVFDVAANSGIGGNTTTQMLARFATDVAAYSPMAMTCWGGTNDGWANTTDVDASVANIAAILALAKAQGIYVFLCTETPSSSKGNTFNALLPYYNDRLRYLAAISPGVELWDFYGQIVDPTSTTGAPKTGVLRDGLHLNALGSSTIAAYVGTKLARWPYRLVSLPASPLDSMAVNGNTKNAVSNPLMTSTGGTLGTGDSGTVPANWTSSGTPTAVFSTPARSDGYGNNLQAVITAADTSSKFISQTITASRVVAGGTYVLESGLDITTPQNLYVVRLTAQITVSGTSYIWGWGPQVQASSANDGHTALAGGIIRSRPFTVPVGTVTGVTLNLQVNHDRTRLAQARRLTISAAMRASFPYRFIGGGGIGLGSGPPPWRHCDRRRSVSADGAVARRA
jgi:lysophospholipase L1-like esterase